MQMPTQEYPGSRRNLVNELAEHVRVKARDHGELANCLFEALTTLVKNHGGPGIVSVKIEGRYFSRDGRWALLSEIYPEKFPTTLPASNVEFKGKISVVLAEHSYDSQITDGFVFMNCRNNRDWLGEDNQFTYSRDITFNVDDLPALYENWMRFMQLEKESQVRVLGFHAAAESLEGKDEEIKAINQEMALLAQKIDELKEKKHQLRANLRSKARESFADADFNERQALHARFPRHRSMVSNF